MAFKGAAVNHSLQLSIALFDIGSASMSDNATPL
jgi:hypothetical protein